MERRLLPRRRIQRADAIAAAKQPQSQIRILGDAEYLLILNGVRIGTGAVVRRAILDKGVVVPPGARIGVDPEEDLAHGFMVQDGLTILGKEQPFP